MRRSLQGILALICGIGGMLFFCASPLASNEGEFTALDVRYEGNFDKVQVFVDNAARGEIARGKTITLRLPGDAHYQITLKRGDIAETKAVYLAKGLRRRLVFYAPNLPE